MAAYSTCTVQYRVPDIFSSLGVTTKFQRVNSHYFHKIITNFLQFVRSCRWPCRVFDPRPLTYLEHWQYVVHYIRAHDKLSLNKIEINPKILLKQCLKKAWLDFFSRYFPTWNLDRKAFKNNTFRRLTPALLLGIDQSCGSSMFYHCYGNSDLDKTHYTWNFGPSPVKVWMYSFFNALRLRFKVARHQ